MPNKNDWRASVVIPADLAERIYRLRSREGLARCTLSDIIRQLIEAGLNVLEADGGND